MNPEWSQTDFYFTNQSLDSQNTNRNQLVYAYFMLNNQLNNVKTKF